MSDLPPFPDGQPVPTHTPASEPESGSAPGSGGDRAANGRFLQGCAPGPGRPRKIRKATTEALDERAAAAAVDLFDVALDLARERNVPALKMLLDRVWPAGRAVPLRVETPPVRHQRDLLTALGHVTDAMLKGEATPAESMAAAKVLDAHCQAFVDVDLERRLRLLETGQDLLWSERE